MKRIIAAILLLLPLWLSASNLDIDSLRADVDSLKTRISLRADSLKIKIAERADSRSSTRWIGQLIKHNFDLNAPGIDYPRFPRAVVKIYNWANETFNSYDSLYVVNAPGNWKATLNSNNQITASTLSFPHSDYEINMSSRPYSDLSASLSFLCLSISASVNVNKLIGRPVTRHSFNFDFTTSRVSGNLSSTSTSGGMRIMRIGDNDLGLRGSIPFEDMTVKSITGEIFYIFNHRRYSRAAAYSFSKFQRRSAGTWVAGLSFARQSIKMDFSALEEKYLETLPDGRSNYSFQYNDYTLLGGYSYNHVIRPCKWMFNIGARLSVGYKHVYEGEIDGHDNMMANDITAVAALLYNHRNFFASISSRYNGYLYYTARFTNFTSYIRFTATAGIRF
ncbi:MAG: DUF4421 domain-containing protein [Duncaniella sp.]|nr:DUF4421 domain-containing protein [Duncaniella sp.]